MDHCRSQMLHDIEFDQNSTEDEQKMGTHLFRRLSHAALRFLCMQMKVFPIKLTGSLS